MTSSSLFSSVFLTSSTLSTSSGCCISTSSSSAVWRYLVCLIQEIGGATKVSVVWLTYVKLTTRSTSPILSVPNLTLESNIPLHVSLIVSPPRTSHGSIVSSATFSYLYKIGLVMNCNPFTSMFTSRSYNSGLRYCWGGMMNSMLPLLLISARMTCWSCYSVFTLRWVSGSLFALCVKSNILLAIEIDLMLSKASTDGFAVSKMDLLKWYTWPDRRLNSCFCISSYEPSFLTKS